VIFQNKIRWINSKKRLILSVVLTLVSSLILYGCVFAPYSKINVLQQKMTEQEVVNLLGQPTWIEMVSQNSVVIKVFVYHYDNADYLLAFRDNRLEIWGTPTMIDIAYKNWLQTR